MPPLQNFFKMCQCLTMGIIRKRARKKWEIFVLANVFIFVVVYMIMSNLKNPEIPISVVDTEIKSGTSSKINVVRRTNSTKILFWTGMYGKYELSAFEINQPFENCPMSCDLTFDKKEVGVSDAVIFHIRDIPTVKMPSSHMAWQRWVFYLQESSENTCLDLSLYKNTFNWTMTHRMDSDIYHPYGRIIPKRKKPNDLKMPAGENLRKGIWSPSRRKRRLLIEKPKLIAWVVSNCYTHSNRESFVSDIEKFIRVDKFGKCGDLKCEGNTSRDCYAFLSQTYKFYFAFENSLCVDYITEKFFESLQFDIVPIVYGDGNYSKVAPPHSYIDARQYRTPEDLANYLYYLDSNPKAYLKYFSWKEAYRIVPSDGWCRLCTKLKSRAGLKTYKDISKWWYNKPNPYKKVGDNTAACLPYPDYPSESWLTRFRKLYFILPWFKS